MINAPQTLEEAKAYKYGQGVFSPGGKPYIEQRCAYEVYGGLSYRQCNRRGNHGPARLYCRQHTKMVHREIVRSVRREASKE